MTAGGTTHENNQPPGRPDERVAGRFPNDEIPRRGAGIVPFSRLTELRAAIAWCLHSWRRPAGSEAQWEQRGTQG